MGNPLGPKYILYNYMDPLGQSLGLHSEHFHWRHGRNLCQGCPTAGSGVCIRKSNIP